MSHVATIKIEVKDLESLKLACEEIGLEFRENQKKYHWYGTSVGDFPLPTGFKAEDLGTCEHAIGIPGNSSAYEIGVCKRRDGKEGYTLLWDFWSGGYGLEKAVGKDCEKLVGSYAKQVARKEVTSMAKRQGWAYSEDFNDNTGETTFTLRRY